MVVKLAAKALTSHPDLNARWQEGGILRINEIHIGVAVDTDAGLLVPVIRDVPMLGIIQVAERSQSLIEKARALAYCHRIDGRNLHRHQLGHVRNRRLYANHQPA